MLGAMQFTMPFRALCGSVCSVLALLSPATSAPQAPASAPSEGSGPEIAALDRAATPVLGELRSFDAEQLVFVDGETERKLPWSELLWLRPGSGKPAGGTGLRLDLVTGGRIAGEILGGDEAGENFLIRSAVLGQRKISIDLIQSVRCVTDGRVQPLEQIRPAGDALREVLYRRSGPRLDPVPGFLEAASDKGLRFQWSGANEPRLYTWKEFGGLWLGKDPEARPELDRPLLWVVLRDDSVLPVRPLAFDGKTWSLDGGELGPMRIPAAELLFVHVEHPKTRLDLSRLEMAGSEARSFFGKDAPVHWPVRKDRPVRDPGLPHNESLIVAGRVHLRGFGVHSYSRLEFVVPEGARLFSTLVGIDDGALALERPGACDFQVLLDGQLVREAKGVRAGVAPRLLRALAVKPGQKLALVVDFGPGQHLGDRANWLSPIFCK
jgi:hypothetical protein